MAAVTAESTINKDLQNSGSIDPKNLSSFDTFIKNQIVVPQVHINNY